MTTRTGVETAVSDEGLFIPLIDFSHFLHGTVEEKQACAKAIVSGFRDAGFIYLKNHGIPEETVKDLFQKSAEFFKRPQSQKESLAWYSARANRGYSTFGREKTTRFTSKLDVDTLREKSPDLKESFEVGRSDQPEYPNLWPDKFDDAGANFKSNMEAFFQTGNKIHIQLMQAIAMGLEIQEDWFDKYCKSADNTLRLLHYPGARKEVLGTGDDDEAAQGGNRKKSKAVRAGAHTDYGTITLLFQDNAGGLQVRSPSGVYVDATPIPGTIVVNAGDLLARWSNDQIKSTEHRVVKPPSHPVVVHGEDGQTEEWYPARYSCVYFCNPDFTSFIEAIPGTYGGDKGERKYPGVKCEDYMVDRLQSTYA
ncbi:hypothetical protein BGX38DRAFT_1175922 [Terfezia claveryi]|nr:hypothetical protein BGX38DRAFT_1175922 [Terfezia claveryi]